MTTITIQLNEKQYKSLEYVAVSPKNWAENVVAERARIAKDEIIAKLVVSQSRSEVLLNIHLLFAVLFLSNLNHMLVELVHFHLLQVVYYLHYSKQPVLL